MSGFKHRSARHSVKSQQQQEGNFHFLYTQSSKGLYIIVEASAAAPDNWLPHTQCCYVMRLRSKVESYRKMLNAVIVCTKPFSLFRIILSCSKGQDGTRIGQVGSFSEQRLSAHCSY